MEKKKVSIKRDYSGWIAVAFLLLVSLVSALTTINENGFTNTNGNITANYFFGKIDVSNITNNIYNYNHTLYSQATANPFNQDLNTTNYAVFHNMTLGDTGVGNINGAGYLSIYNNGSTNNSFQISLKSQNTNYNSQYIWYNSSDFALGIDNWGFDGTATGGVLIDNWGLSQYGLLVRQREGSGVPITISNAGSGNDLVAENFTLKNGIMSLGSATFTGTHYVQVGNSTTYLRLATSPTSTVISSLRNPLEFKSSNGAVYLDQASVDNTLRIRDLDAKEAVINSSNTNILFGANVTALYFKGDGSQLTGISAVGGNPFNQNLNTTSESSLGALNVSLTTSSGDRGPAVNIVSRNQNQSAVWITGNESDKGTLKIAHTGYVGDGTSSAISIDLQGTGTSAKGIFIDSTTGGTTGRYIYISNGSADVYSINNQVQQVFRPTFTTSTNASALLVEKDDGTDIFKVDTVSDLIYTGTLRPRTNMTQDVGQASILYRGAYFDQNVTARYFKGDGSLLTNLPGSTGGYNITYDETSQDVTANRSIWGTNHSSVLISQFGTLWYNLTSPAITYANTKAATGNCAAGFVVQNTTTAGVQCVPASTSTTNDGITINGANITAGTIDFLRLPSLIDRLTLNIANITNFGYNYNTTSLAISYVDSKNYITSTNVAYTNISNNFARTQNVSGNITIRPGDNVCLDGDACTKRIYSNGSNVIIQG